ncbi:binding protein, partial [Lasius niger]
MAQIKEDVTPNEDKLNDNIEIFDSTAEEKEMEQIEKDLKAENLDVLDILTPNDVLDKVKLFDSTVNTSRHKRHSIFVVTGDIKGAFHLHALVSTYVNSSEL